MVNRLMNAHREQSRAAEQILAAVEVVRDTARRQDGSTGELSRALEQLGGSVAKVRAAALRSLRA
jgi:hypothetical protein